MKMLGNCVSPGKLANPVVPGSISGGFELVVQRL